MRSRLLFRSAPVLALAALAAVPAAASAASLPVKAAPMSTLTGDNRGAVRLVLRSTSGKQIARVQAALVTPKGRELARASAGSFTGQTVLRLPLSHRLPAGGYTLRLTGRAVGSSASQTAQQPLRFAPGATPGGVTSASSTTGLTTQTTTLNWTDGQWKGAEAAGFVAPGIGHGELVCRPDAQWIRFYPDSLSRETSMMNWTFRDWDAWQEYALREALHTQGTGPDFREGINKFGPTPEKHSTGYFDGIISDRGVINGAGGAGGLAPPTTLHLEWTWDMSSMGHESCHMTATFTTETASTATPLARSAQVLWRGESNAPGNTSSSVDVPGLGPVTLTCEPGTAGTRTLRVDTPNGADVETREGSDHPTVSQAIGPVVANLPNNGMVSVTFAGGQTLLASSRWKANDPDASQNFCTVAAQVVQP